MSNKKTRGDTCNYQFFYVIISETEKRATIFAALSCLLSYGDAAFFQSYLNKIDKLKYYWFYGTHCA